MRLDYANAARCSCPRMILGFLRSSASSFWGLCCGAAPRRARPLPLHQPLRFCNNLHFVTHSRRSLLKTQSMALFKPKQYRYSVYMKTHPPPQSGDATLLQHCSRCCAPLKTSSPPLASGHRRRLFSYCKTGTATKWLLMPS